MKDRMCIFKVCISCFLFVCFLWMFRLITKKEHMFKNLLLYR